MSEWDFIDKFELPKGTDLALWWIGWICVIAMFTHTEGAKDIILALGGGMVGFLTGRAVGHMEPQQPIITQPTVPTVKPQSNLGISQ